MEFIKINKHYEGGIPKGYNLVVAEEGNINKTAIILYGFDELHSFDYEFNNPVYGFLKH